MVSRSGKGKMSKKYKDFRDLDLRQKRRRLSLVRKTRKDAEDLHNSNSSFDERWENEVNSESGSDEKPHQHETEITISSDSEDAPTRSGEDEDLSHDEEADVHLLVKDSKIIRITNSGRVSKRPKHLQTTSEDDGPSVKRTKSSIPIESEESRVRAALRLYNVLNNSTVTGIKNETVKKTVTTESPSHINPDRSTSHNSSSPEDEVPFRFVSPTAKIDDANDHFANTLELLLEIKNEGEITRKQNQIVLQQMKEMKEQNEQILKQNKEIIGQYKEMKKNAEAVKMILEKRSNMHVKDDVFSSKLFEPLDGFPLRTLAEFEMVECDTSNKLRNDLYQYLKNRGAAKMREFFSLALKVSMTDQLISQFTWLGSTESAKFGDTRISNVIYQAAKDCPDFEGPQNKNSYKEEIKEVFRSTKQRFRLSLKKAAAENFN